MVTTLSKVLRTPKRLHLFYVLLNKHAISIDSHTSINKFYSFVIFSLMIDAVIL